MTQQQNDSGSHRRPVHKFGGSSLADAACFHRVADIINSQGQPDALIVVSASGKTTNRLIELLSLFVSGDNAAAATLEGLYSFQRGLIESTLSETEAPALLAALDEDIRTIATVLETQRLDDYQRSFIQSFGELWSSRLLASLLNSQGLPASSLDARRFLRVSGSPVQVEEALSRRQLHDILSEHPDRILVVTGFIAADAEGRTRLLGRNGSDFSATLLAALADSSHSTIWSDVPGVFSADPRRVKEARLLSRLSLPEAAELARLGSPVLHCRTLGPVAASQQQLMLRCSYHPNDGHTRIQREPRRDLGARIVTSVDDAVLVEMTIPDRYQDTVNALTEWLTRRELAPLASKRRPERKRWQIVYTREQAEQVFSQLRDHQPAGGFEGLQQREGFSLVALVGKGVTGQAEQCLHFYHALNEQPLEFIQPASNGLSLVGVVRKIVLDPLLLRLHQSLFSRARRVGIILFGRGNIGQAWLKLYQQQKARLEQTLNVQLTLYGVFDSKGAMLASQGLEVEQVLNDFQPASMVWPDWLENLEEHGFDQLVALDLTASDHLVQYYPDLVQQHVHLIAANKLAGASEQGFYLRLKQTLAEHRVQFLSNATVGAGLPVQSSLRQLQQSGEQIRAISGIFSGTLSWLFLHYDGSQPFSELVLQAWQQGLTEPDPRQDLNGQDVKRKLVILAREAGFDLDPERVRVSDLVPGSLATLDKETFFDRLAELDQPLAEALARARKEHGVLRHVARFDAVSGEARVGLEVVADDHAFAHLRPGDNVFAIETQHYRQNPLVIQGPGAGREVTAGAMQADLWSLLASL
ncbi:bifunctional aspartate kinase/homoserine dehydrogenase II [Oceanisphaera psychrotolerans]|uniref:Bifunctional aspartokinase/homoserine dehydrogenase n=1 Tax=Oceanisphaera psychrotolerans TaxID=1414654 RepID=A0A1J4QAQ9_9GAMM|nr:bifunctional aspartate kinase/homoserine dehydrogenase II [Oceanisphaera psychrotolerans]OIN05553.1 bifunctional aspartate kinase/homoserine dehydrogenase II [Oceanisphaera psychrotolerans]